VRRGPQLAVDLVEPEVELLIVQGDRHRQVRTSACQSDGGTQALIGGILSAIRQSIGERLLLINGDADVSQLSRPGRIAFAECDRARFNGVRARRERGRCRTERHPANRHVANGDRRENALGVTGAHGDEDHSQREASNRDHGKKGNPEGADPDIRNRRQARCARSCPPYFLWTGKRRPEDARNPRLLSQGLPSSGSGRGVLKGDGD
jgi:hypothetical protein